MPDDKLAKLQAAERAIRGRYTQNGNAHDRSELDAAVYATSWRAQPSMRTVECDCICNCGSVVTVVRPPTKGTDESFCMACLEKHRRGDPGHRPMPEARVAILPPDADVSRREREARRHEGNTERVPAGLASGMEEDKGG